MNCKEFPVLASILMDAHRHSVMWCEVRALSCLLPGVCVGRREHEIYMSRKITIAEIVYIFHSILWVLNEWLHILCSSQIRVWHFLCNEWMTNRSTSSILGINHDAVARFLGYVGILQQRNARVLGKFRVDALVCVNRCHRRPQISYVGVCVQNIIYWSDGKWKEADARHDVHISLPPT